ncbi:hypothetical protein [Phenylobacterium sp.]|uniref:hypothetical protein n=1 Tax=Phenylobacterium sp. TaxID=1871053 RepID=UPI003BAD5681
MKTLAPADMVRVWDLGQRRPNWQRALIMLEPALPELSADALSNLSIGQRNARLFALRQSVVGPVMNALVKCPKCGEPLEFEQLIAELIEDYADPTEREFEVTEGRYCVRHRLLTSADLARAGGRGGLEEVRAHLTRSAVVSATFDGVAIDVDDLPSEVVAAVEEQMDAADPLARVAIPLACAGCEHVWPALFDIATYFWAELDARAKQALQDVIALARHYGWGETEILAMSPARRDYYLGAIP